MFTRGQTQVLTTCTLGGTKDNQLMDDLTDEQTKRYIHHYNFPPYSVGEARAPRSPGRREIGHGALAERALVPVLPSLEEFPYTIRCVSEVLSSNGSTSQASICGSTLALMDAGAHQGPRGRNLLRPDHRGRSLDDHAGHPGRRGLPRRYGLQGGRYPQGHHRHSDGH